MNLQVWLHEQGTIAFHYGPNNVTDVTRRALWQRGFEQDPNDPAFLAYGDFASWAFGAQGWGNAWPADGTQYIFNPVAVASGDR